MFLTRIKIALVILGLIFVVLMGRLFRLQVVHSDWYRAEAERRLERPPKILPTRRGSILDRRGIVLASDSPAWDVGVYYPFLTMEGGFVERLAYRWRSEPADVRSRVKKVWQDLSDITGVPMRELLRRQAVIRRRVVQIKKAVERRTRPGIVIAEETYGRPGSVAHAIIKDVDLDVVGAIESQPERFPGLAILPTSKRKYPHGDAACHVIGRIGRVAETDFAPAADINKPFPEGHLKRYFFDDTIGRAGVERSREAVLRGARGIEQYGIERNLLKSSEAEPGADVRLTLDIALQVEVEELLDRATLGPPADGAQEDRDDEEKPIRAAAVVIDVATGEILVLASTPRYDLNTFGARYSEMLEDESRPMVHRAVAGQYPAGSVFKAVTATAALHLNAISAATLLTCQGCLDTSKPNEWRCFRHMSHGAIALREAIKRSCNVYFYRLGRTIGAEDLERWSHKLGFGQKTGVELPGEAGGHVPGDPYSGRRDWRDPRNLAVGQGTLLVTPLQVAQLYGIIATGGRMRRPHIVLSPRSRRPKRMNVGLKPGHMALLRDAFAAVVNEPGGTGFRHVRVRNVMIAGKTGTAESGRGRETHAWFAGFAPAGNPRIAFAVIVEHGGLGGSVAGPVAREIVLRTMAHGYLNGTRLAEGRGLR